MKFPPLCLLLILLGLGLGHLVTRPDRGGGSQWSNALYVWQEAWSPAVTRAIERAAPHVDGFMVFAAEIRLEQQQPAARLKSIDWTALARAARPVTLVIRAETKVVGLLASPSGLVKVANLLQDETRALQAGARERGVNVAGVQLDFDCPTARLGQYRELLDAVRPAFQGLDFSITTLPTWLQSRQFKRLVRGLTYFVLQVHSIKAPKTIEADVHLVDFGQLDENLRQASAAGVPFHVALPTYGYRLFFNRQGACTGFGAEGPPARLPAGTRERVVSAQPGEVAPVVLRLKAKPPRGCLGVIWFRLPVDSDSLNWPWPALQAVMAGRVPILSYNAELRSPTPGLYEVWVRNTGEGTTHGHIAIPVGLGRRNSLARDALSGWEWDTPGHRLEGPPPALGECRQVAWFRMMPLQVNDRSESITLGKVEILP